MTRQPRWWITALLCALLFVAALVGVETGATGADDRTLERSAHSAFGPPTYRFFEAVSDLGGGTVRVILIAFTVAALAFTRRWWSAVVTVAVTGGAALLETIIKIIVDRPRPQLFAHVVTAGGSSFPSGHATDTCALALVIVFLVWQLSGRPGLTLVTAIPLAGFVALVGLSRVVLGVHYPTDVVGGYFLAGSWMAIVTAALAAGLQHERARIASRDALRST